MSSNPLVGNGTKSFANEMNATLWPSPLSTGTMLLPFEGGGELPSAWLARVVAVVQVVLVATTRHALRTKIFSTPFETFSPRLVALDANAII